MNEWNKDDVVQFTDDKGRTQVARRTNVGWNSADKMGLGMWQVCIHGFWIASDEYIDAHDPVRLVPQ